MQCKMLIITTILCFTSALRAQNLQWHFDPRHAICGNELSTVNYLTVTFEMFKPDRWGNTFMFADFDFHFDKRNLGLVYAEIARKFKLVVDAMKMV